MTLDLNLLWELAVKVGIVGAFMMAIFIFALWKRIIRWDGDVQALLAEKDAQLAEKDEQLRKSEAKAIRWERMALTNLEANRDALARATGKPPIETMASRERG